MPIEFTNKQTLVKLFIYIISLFVIVFITLLQQKTVVELTEFLTTPKDRFKLSPNRVKTLNETTRRLNNLNDDRIMKIKRPYSAYIDSRLVPSACAERSWKEVGEISQNAPPNEICCKRHSVNHSMWVVIVCVIEKEAKADTQRQRFVMVCVVRVIVKWRQKQKRAYIQSYRVVAVCVSWKARCYFTTLASIQFYIMLIIIYNVYGISWTRSFRCWLEFPAYTRKLAKLIRVFTDRLVVCTGFNSLFSMVQVLTWFVIVFVGICYFFKQGCCCDFTTSHYFFQLAIILWQ